MASRQNVQREWKLLSWWLAQYHSDAEIWMNVRVGPTRPPPVQQADNPFWEQAARVVNRWADAVFYENGELTLVEAKIDPWPGIFSELLHYARKLRLDPAWAWAESKRLNLVALVKRDDPSVRAEAPSYGVQWVVYNPFPEQGDMPLPPGWENHSVEVPLPQDFPARIDLLKIGRQ